jgi:hypothetical protein
VAFSKWLNRILAAKDAVGSASTLAEAEQSCKDALAGGSHARIVSSESVAKILNGVERRPWGLLYAALLGWFYLEMTSYSFKYV